MYWFGLLLASALILVSLVAAAAETAAKKKAASDHMVCIAMAKPTHNRTYASRVFQVSGPSGGTHTNNLAFKDYLAKKYGYPTAVSDAMCTSGSSASGLEDYKKKRLDRVPNVVQTNWTPGVTQ